MKRKEKGISVSICIFCFDVRTEQNCYERIDRRVDLMMESGLEEEVRFLKDRGVSSTSTAMQRTLGIKNCMHI